MDPVPHQQITFAKWLRKLQGTMLQGALCATSCGSSRSSICAGTIGRRRGVALGAETSEP